MNEKSKNNSNSKHVIWGKRDNKLGEYLEAGK